MNRTMTPEQRAAMNRVMREVEFERMEQHFKWGEQDRPSFMEDHDKGDALRALQGARENVELAAQQGNLTYSDILMEEIAEAFCEADNPVDLRTELVQCAAVLVAWIECLDRKRDLHIPAR